jgi:endonuclease/exonuclease/phosphatase family metal-dependent hydrolase
MKIIVHKLLIGLGFTLLVLAHSAYGEKLKVMTQNQYLGADIASLLSTSTADELNQTLFNLLQQIAESNVPARIQAQAKLIKKRKPDVVGLQEVALISCRDDFDTGACSDPSIKGAFVDHLSLTLSALNDRYQAAAAVVNFNVPEIPFDPYGTGVPALLSFVDRDVILIRTDLTASAVDYSSTCTKPVLQDGCNYFAALGPITTPYGDAYIERGYVGVDVTVKGKNYRVVNTHLEVKDPPIPSVFQNAQAQELIATLAATTPSNKTLVVMGDINSSPEDTEEAPYGQFLAGGYTDVWTVRPSKRPGFTCCQLADLSNHRSNLYERVDMIFSLDSLVGVKKPYVLGKVVSSNTLSHKRRLWSSDHDAVAATLKYD